MAEVKVTDPVADQLKERYPSNSITAIRPQPQAQPSREKVEGVVKGRTVLQKETLGKKFKRLLFPGDMQDMRKYAVEQILLPSLKNGALALVELALFGSVSRRSTTGLGAQRTNYSYISSSNVQKQSGPVMTQRDRATHNFQNVIFETYEDAEEVISTLIDLVDRYGSARVSDFYDAAKIDCDYASENWGWKTFRRLETKAVHGGYIIDVDPPVLLR